jgi:hypothetical protein
MPADELLPDEPSQTVPVIVTTAVLPVMLTDPAASPRTDPGDPGGNYVRQDAKPHAAVAAASAARAAVVQGRRPQ